MQCLCVALNDVLHAPCRGRSDRADGSHRKHRASGEIKGDKEDDDKSLEAIPWDKCAHGVRRAGMIYWCTQAKESRLVHAHQQAVMRGYAACILV
jgi:hypothetical protein